MSGEVPPVPEEILHALSELTPVYRKNRQSATGLDPEVLHENDRSYFVLGNDDRELTRRLNLLFDRLNCRHGSD